MIKSLKNLRRIRDLGSGGYGCVELYTCPSSKQLFAVKRMFEGSTDAAIDEFKLMSNVVSPFVNRVSQVLVEDGNCYTIMPPLLGGTLQSITCGKSLCVEQIKFYIACVILGLEAMHDKGIVHRDIKPQNVVLDDNGYPCIIDFGISTNKTKMEQEVHGTLPYFSPEMGHAFLRGAPCIQDEKVDVWALGIMLYKILYGKFPYESLDELSKNVSFPSEVKVDEDLKSLILHLLSSKPSDRPTMAEIKKHSFFTSIDWKKLQEKKIKPPVPARKKLVKKKMNQAGPTRKCLFLEFRKKWSSKFNRYAKCLKRKMDTFLFSK
jgi:serine/threonine protein kinase